MPHDIKLPQHDLLDRPDDVCRCNRDVGFCEAASAYANVYNFQRHEESQRLWQASENGHREGRAMLALLEMQRIQKANSADGGCPTCGHQVVALGADCDTDECACRCSFYMVPQDAEQSEEPPGTVIKQGCVSLTPQLMFSILHGPGTDAANGYNAINPAVKEGWGKLALFVERMTRKMIAEKQTIQAESDTPKITWPLVREIGRIVARCCKSYLAAGGADNMSDHDLESGFEIYGREIIDALKRAGFEADAS